MNIPITSTLGFLGLVLLVTGLFLLLTGFEIFKIKQVSVMPGKKTWGVGSIMIIIGVAFLIPELLKSNQISEVGTETPLSSPATAAETSYPPTIAITETRQPSTIDVPDPLGADVLEFAANVNFDNEPQGSIQKIAGIWDSDWNRQGGPYYAGTATILAQNDNWITIIYQGDDGGQFVIKAKFIDKQLIGRYINLHSETDTTPWVGIMVDDNRIDGKWTGGEWNFTRNP